jgi:hypothetical protein
MSMKWVNSSPLLTLELATDTEEYDRVCQDAFQRVRFILDAVADSRITP